MVKSLRLAWLRRIFSGINGPWKSFLQHLLSPLGVTTKKSKEFYALLIKDKAQLPYIAYKLQNDFNFTSDQLKQIFQLPHSVTLEAYVKAFQYKVLNSILYTNTKLYKMGFRTNDLCSFCKGQPESLNHLLFHCPYSKQFWKDFEIYPTFMDFEQKLLLNMKLKK